MSRNYSTSFNPGLSNEARYICVSKRTVYVFFSLPNSPVSKITIRVESSKEKVRSYRALECSHPTHEEDDEMVHG